MNKPTLGVIVGNRGFFPDHLADTGRKTILKVLEEEGINAIALTPEDSKFGSVENNNDAHKLADLFKAHRERDRRRAAHAAQFRRRAADCEYAALGRAWMCPCWCRPRPMTRRR